MASKRKTASRQAVAESSAPARPKRGRPPTGASRNNKLQVKCRAPWLVWLAECAAKDRGNIAQLIDRATRHYARSNGWSEPPPR